MPALVFAGSIFFALSLLAPSASGQTGAVQSGTQPAAQRSPGVSAQPQVGQTQRERRAQAYAKMLEGQRHYFEARSGATTQDRIKLAREAFQRAAELDPTLAEARTALAEIAFYFFDDLEQAEREGLAAVGIDSNNFGARRILSRVYTFRSGLAEGKPAPPYANKAVAELREVTRLRPNDSEAWALLAEFHYAAGRNKEAAQALEKLAALPSSIEGRFYEVVTRGRELTPDAASARLAEVLLSEGRTVEALAAVRRALTFEPEKPGYLALLGRVMDAGGGGSAEAAEELRRIVALNPKNVPAVSMLAGALARSGRVDEAVRALRSGIDEMSGRQQEQFSLQQQLAQVYADAHRYDDAIKTYEEMLKARGVGEVQLTADRDRRFAQAVLINVINLQRLSGKGDSALVTVERLRRLLGPADPVPDVQRINLLRGLGRRAEALNAAREARRRNPGDERLLRLEAFTLAESGRVDEGVQLIRARLNGGPEDYDQYVVIASLLMSSGRGGEAVDAARKALELASAGGVPEQKAEALVLLSSAQERAGDAKGSEDSLRQVLAQDPGNPTALNNLGYFLTERNERLEEALDMIQRAVKADPTNASFLDSLGWVYFKLGKLSEAERYLSEAARRNPTSATIQEHLGDLFARLGQKNQAQASWQKALSLTTEVEDISRIKAKLSGRTQ